MKLIKPLRLLVLMLFACCWLTACEEDDDRIWGDPSTLFTIADENNLTAPAMVRFVNRSKNAEEYHWTFPGGRIVRNGVITQDSTSTDVQPEFVYYPYPGEYTASLRTRTEGKDAQFGRDFVIPKPQPRITHDPVGIVYDDTVTFSVSFFRYEEYEHLVTYNWDLGNGETSTQANPQTSYNPPGQYIVSLELFDGVETLNASITVNVQAEIAKTLYITDAISQNLHKTMLYSGAQAPLEQMPVDVGLHPLSVSVYQERLVVSMAGDNIRFSPTGTPPDGEIFTTNLAGGNRYTITSPSIMEHSYIDDPFVSTVGPDGTVYWLDRFQGVRKAHISEVNAEYPDPFVWAVAAEMAEILGVSSTYGWTDGTVRIVNNQIWYSKHGTGNGLYIFNLDGSFHSKIDNLFSLKIRTFEVDWLNQKIYFAINNAAGGYNPGLYVSEIDGSNIQLIDDLTGFSMQGGEAERTYVTSIVVDADGGYIYYPFRHESDLNNLGEIIGDGSASGVKRWAIDQSGGPEFFVTGLIPYGIGIDHTKR